MPATPPPTNVTDLGQILISVNANTGGYAGAFILLGIFMIGILSMKDYPSNQTFAVSGFFTVVCAIIFLALGVITWVVMTGVLVMFTAAVFFLWNTQD